MKKRTIEREVYDRKVVPIIPVHTLLSPSASKRWMACPDSARANAEAAEERTKDYADEGTAAHALLEMCLRLDNTPDQYMGVLMHNQFAVTEEMAGAVQVALDYIREWQYRNPKGHVFIEHRVHWGGLLRLHPDISSGTSDVILVTDTHCTVMDYKHGAGVAVDAEDNSQLKLYAVGSLDLHGAEEINICVVQPRARHDDGPVREWKVKRDDLVKWLMRTVAPAAQRVVDGDRSRTAGDHCRWCKVQGNCRTLKEAAMEAARHAFDPIPTIGEDDVVEQLTPRDVEQAVHELSPEEVAEALTMLPTIESWCKALHAHALRTLLDGTGTVPGYKLVQGRRPPRKWTNEEQVIAAAKKAKLNIDAYMPRELISPTRMEALPVHKGKQGKEAFRKAFDALTQRDDAAPHIAPVDDPRPEYVRGSEFDAIDPA